MGIDTNKRDSGTVVLKQKEITKKKYGRSLNHLASQYRIRVLLCSRVILSPSPIALYS